MKNNLNSSSIPIITEHIRETIKDYLDSSVELRPQSPERDIEGIQFSSNVVSKIQIILCYIKNILKKRVANLQL